MKEKDSKETRENNVTTVKKIRGNKTFRLVLILILILVVVYLLYSVS